MLVVNNFSDVSAHFRSVTSQYKQSKQSKITDALKKKILVVSDLFDILPFLERQELQAASAREFG